MRLIDKLRKLQLHISSLNLWREMGRLFPQLSSKTGAIATVGRDHHGRAPK